MEKKVSFHTLGCRLNMSETGQIAQTFVEKGYKVVPFGQESDVTFLNTCTVTDGADSSCRNLIRKAQKNSPEGKVVVAGCYAQMEAEKIKKMKKSKKQQRSYRHRRFKRDLKNYASTKVAHTSSLCKIST